MLHSTLLVTGGSGFIGREVCRAARTMGHKVVSVSHKGRPTVHEGWAQDVQWVAATIFQPDRWTDCIVGCDAVIHCIGTQRERRSEGITFERLNYESTTIVTKAAKKAGIDRFIYISGVEIPGPSGPSGYLRSKQRAEQEVKASNFSTVILRPAVVFDPKQPKSILLTLKSAVPSLNKGGAKLRPLTVEQVATAAVLAAVDASIKGLLEPDAIANLAATV